LKKEEIEVFKDRFSAIKDYIYFDKQEFLREKTTHPSKLSQMIKEANELLKDCAVEDLYFLNGAIGNLYRINGQPQKAIQYLTDCLKIAVEVKNIRKEIIALIRLGEALKYNGLHQRAIELFNKALDLCKTHNIDEYEDFVWQHKGKCLMELERLNEAEECFMKSFEIRRKKGNDALMHSTQQAINLLKKLS